METLIAIVAFAIGVYINGEIKDLFDLETWAGQLASFTTFCVIAYVVFRLLSLVFLRSR